MRVCTWVEQDDGSKAAQLGFIHLHVPHLAHKFCQNSAEVKRRKHLQTQIRVQDGRT